MVVCHRFEACDGLLYRSANRQFRQRGSRTTITASVDLKPPPYPLNALEPHMSKETLDYHWGKHHRTYVENLNKQIVGTELDGMILEDIILATYNKGVFLPPFNNAAQVWNHEFFWESMKPDGGGKPSEELLELINKDFGSFEKFVNQFKLAASTQFGSGWAWLSPNAVNPLVWDYSHAYYLDFQNRRPDYITTFMEKLVSWEAVSSRLELAKARATEREMQEERRKREEEEGELAEKAVEMYVESNTDDSEAE
ncbi:Manganese/iron superoxide dismutase, N-terminal [Dillenia turbinata]|uniref:Superoxide dismutase n=1 Tax=Dillenia turbinata TaxID=194707 RepID=A0AAN8VVB1_9MAGN